MSDQPFPIEFAVTPRFDLFYALHALTSAAPTALDEWKERALLRLPRDFERVARRLAPTPLFWPLLADSLEGLPGEITFDEMIEHLGAVSPDDLKLNVLSGIFHDAETVNALIAGRKTLRRVLTDEKLRGGELLAHFALRPYAPDSAGPQAVATLLDDPESFRDELVLVLERFWQTGFKRDWLALEPALRADAFRMKELHENGSLLEDGRGLKLPLAVDAKTKALRSKAGQSIAFDLIDRCYFIPSAFNTRRWWAKYESKNRRLRLYFPVWSSGVSANDVVERERNREPARASGETPVNAEAVFRALGDTTRYAIASILAREPTSSADLSRKLGVSKPTITHHIQALRSADLITDTPDGGSTRLSLNAATLQMLSQAALDQLFSSTRDLQLTTTRKRQK